MKKYVFGLGSAQVLVTAVVVGLVAHFVCGQPGPAAIVVGNGLALSSTAVVLQVRGSPVLGYLAAGILIGPYGLSIIRHVHGTKAIAEFGVVFLLFNIGLEVGFIFISLAVAFAFYVSS